MILILAIFSISILLLIIACGVLYNKNIKLKLKLEEINNSAQELAKIGPGARGILPDYELIFEKGKDTEHHFCVTYEVEVVEVSIDKIKVKAIDFTSHDHQANDPANRTELIRFMENKWISMKK